MKDKFKYVVDYILMVCIMLIVAFVVLLWINYEVPTCNTVSSANTTSTSQPLKYASIKDLSQNKISIPALSNVTFKEGRNNQTLRLFNPKSNQCYFNISLELSNGTVLYRTGLLKPNDSITDISIYKRLQRGVYKDCVIKYDCYSLDNKYILNNAAVKIDITVV